MPPTVTPPTVTPPTVHQWVRLGVVILICLFVGSAATAILMELANRDTALRIIAQDDAGQVAMRDGRLAIYTKVDRSRACRAETSHWLFTMVPYGDAGPVRLWVPIAEDGPIPTPQLGVTSYVLSVPLPPGLWPSEWFWIADRIEYCGLFGWLFPRRYESQPLLIDIERTRASPDVPVTAEHDGKTTVRSRSPLAPQGKK